MSEESFQHLIESMPQRNKVGLKAKGGPTQYLQDVRSSIAFLGKAETSTTWITHIQIIKINSTAGRKVHNLILDVMFL